MTPIFWTSWKEFCEEHGEIWEKDNSLPREQLLYVTADHFDFLVREHGNSLGEKVIVSAGSDYGFEKYDPNMHERDARRFWPMFDISGHGMRDIFFPARCNQDRCVSIDNYCVRCYSWVCSTFPKVPNRKAWFSTNNHLDYAHRIPFGTDKESFDLVNKYKDLPKKDRIFYCCSFNTNERLSLYNQFSNIEGFHCKKDLDKEEYTYEMCSSKYVLCPNGNGKDSYRILDAIYGGIIPLLIGDTTWSPYRGLVGKLTTGLEIVYEPSKEDIEISDLDYWRRDIMDCLDMKESV